MKTRLIAIALLALFAPGILSGCAGPSARQPNAPANPTEANFSDVPKTANEPAPTPTVPQRITAEDAEAIALSHAGIAAADVLYMRTEFDYDDGVPEYDIEFHAGGLEYEYDIHANTGEILRQRTEPEKVRETGAQAAPAAPQPTEPPATQPSSSHSGRLSKDEVIAIALKDAGLSEDQVTRLRTEFDYDDGVPEYEVDFRQGGYEYDYEIHAETGAIISRDIDRDN